MILTLKGCSAMKGKYGIDLSSSPQLSETQAFRKISRSSNRTHISRATSSQPHVRLMSKLRARAFKMECEATKTTEY